MSWKLQLFWQESKPSDLNGRILHLLHAYPPSKRVHNYWGPLEFTIVHRDSARNGKRTAQKEKIEVIKVFRRQRLPQFHFTYYEQHPIFQKVGTLHSCAIHTKVSSHSSSQEMRVLPSRKSFQELDDDWTYERCDQSNANNGKTGRRYYSPLSKF